MQPQGLHEMITSRQQAPLCRVRCHTLSTPHPILTHLLSRPLGASMVHGSMRIFGSAKDAALNGLWTLCSCIFTGLESCLAWTLHRLSFDAKALRHHSSFHHTFNRYSNREEDSIRMILSKIKHIACNNQIQDCKNYELVFELLAWKKGTNPAKSFHFCLFNLSPADLQKLGTFQALSTWLMTCPGQLVPSCWTIV